MALQTQRPIVTVVPSSGPEAQQRGHGNQHRGLRITLVVLSAFMALTTLQGAIFVVPSMPREWLHHGLFAPFADYTIPALALGILCGGSALIAVGTLLAQPRLGALAALAAGAIMIGFELVEIVVVGFTAAMMPTQPVAWLQLFFLILGAAMVALSLRLWRVETGSYRLPWQA